MPLALLRDLQGEELKRRYSAILDKLPRLSGIVGTIFLKAQNEIQDPAKLRRLVGLIDGETWLGLGVDVKGSRTAASGPRPRCSTGGFLWRPGSTCARSRWRAIPKSTRRRGRGFSGVDIVPEVVRLCGKRVSAEPNTEHLWIYDLRTNHRFTFEGAADDARRS